MDWTCVGQVDSDSSCLSLDWANRSNAQAQPCVATSLSNGKLARAVFTPSAVDVLEEWQAHELETWIVSFDTFSSDIVYSGADDCKLKAWDLRASTEYPIFQNNSHEAGVTVVSPHPTIQHLLATGSYDEKVRIFDSRAMRHPLTEFACGYGGGVWRLRWHPSDRYACAWSSA